METKEYRLGELAKFSNGINFDKEAYFGNGIRLITVSDFGNNFSPAYESLIEVSNEVVKEKDLISKNDILFVRSNDNKKLVGRCMLIDNVDKPTTYSGFCIKCHFDNEELTNPKYFTYYFKDQYFRKCISNASGGTNIQNLNQEILSKHKVQLPPLPTQQKIASILSAYDNLIQNYKKQIEALQTAASELYKEWFVRFRFPGWQNAKFENGIPEGWKVERIGTLYDSTSGGTPSREHEEYFQNGTYPWIKTGELKDSPILETDESITDEAIKHSSAKLFEKDSLIIAMYGATIGQLGINKMKATCNQACCVLRPKKDKAFGIYYLFHFFKENREFIIGLGNGAAQQNLSQVLINKLKIVNPNKEILEIFEEKESMFFEKIYHLQQQITNLTQQRDLLLPRLMSGKLEVK